MGIAGASESQFSFTGTRNQAQLHCFNVLGSGFHIGGIMDDKKPPRPKAPIVPPRQTVAPEMKPTAGGYYTDSRPYGPGSLEQQSTGFVPETESVSPRTRLLRNVSRSMSDVKKWRAAIQNLSRAEAIFKTSEDWRTVSEVFVKVEFQLAASVGLVKKDLVEDLRNNAANMSIVDIVAMSKALVDVEQQFVRLPHTVS